MSDVLFDADGNEIHTEASDLPAGQVFCTVVRDVGGQGQQVFESPVLPHAALGIGELISAAILEAGFGKIPEKMRIKLYLAQKEEGRVSLNNALLLCEANLEFRKDKYKYV